MCTVWDVIERIGRDQVTFRSNEAEKPSHGCPSLYGTACIVLSSPAAPATLRQNASP
jgi:hypothetical protein